MGKRDRREQKETGRDKMRKNEKERDRRRQKGALTRRPAKGLAVKGSVGLIKKSLSFIFDPKRKTEEPKIVINK